MDPDRALQDMRDALHALATAEEGSEAERAAHSDLAEAALALDGWISRGGRLPKAWRPY